MGDGMIRYVAEIDLQEYKDVENIAFYQVAANLGSGLCMESERSLRIHICTDHNDVNFLLEFLHHLVESKDHYRNVTNLLFHGIEWQPQGIQLLCSYLGPGSNVKQVEFQKNVFSTKSAIALVPLSEMLQRNNTLNAVVFNDCGIGATGATLLASALANNRSVEEFQVWEDSIGSKGAEELSKMIEVNYMLKLLIILDNSSIAAAPLMSAVLARNRRVEVHIWGHSRDTRGGMNSCKIVEFLPATGNMRIYNNINSTGLQRVACALAWNTTVTTLDMTGVPLKSKWTKELRGVLDRNRSLKAVKLTRCCLRDKAVVYIAAGLFKNKYLESLILDGNCFGGVGLEHLLCPLSTFSPIQIQANSTLKTIIQQSAQVYEVCNDLIKILHDWRLKNNKAVIRWAEFCEICQLNIPALRLRSRRDNVEKVNTRRRAVAKSLHTLGEIVFFEELGLLVMNCEWFCRDFLSQLATLKLIKIESSGGFVRKEELEKILQEKLRNQVTRSNWRTGASLQASDIINILLELELCYEQDPGNPHTLLLLPAILEENKGETDKWQLTMPECRFVGRRLECEDIHMLLTSDFFPRLQVRLHNKIMCLHQEAVYNLEKNLIYTVINGVHVKVELGMKLGSSIDVLACSGKNVTEMVRLLHKFVIPTILNWSPNMTFKESILRPDCVKHLILRRFRATQQLPLKKLKQILLSLPAESIYDYQHTWSAVESNKRVILRSGSDHARDLLSDDDFHEVLHRRYYDLQYLATELAITPDNLQQPETIPEADVVDPSILGIAKGVEMVLQRLKIIEQGIRDLKEEIASLRYYEYHLVTELHRKMDYVMNYSIQLEDRKVPQMFYLVSLDNRSKKLVTRILPGMRSLRVHMLCEFRREMHVVEDQVGCDMIQVDNQAVQSLLPYMSKFMKLLTFALKIGAHFIVGMGEMIPDLSKEVVHLMDSSAMYGAATSAASLGALGAAAMYGRTRNSGASDMGEDMQAARQWLLDFLRGQGILTGMDIAQSFGLWRVRYRDDGHIAWVCRKHIAARGDEIFELPL
ncbi:hypothetical protein ACQ4PT_001579 [Festuca glaucescens]